MGEGGAVNDPVTELLRAGLEHYLAGHLREAIASWQEALRHDPDNTRAREYLRSALGTQGSPRPGADAVQRQSAPPQRSARPATAWDVDGGSIELDFVTDDGLVPPTTGEMPRQSIVSVPSSADEAETLMRGARELYALNDFSGALELLDKVRVLTPQHAEADRMREDCAETLTAMYESQLGPLDGVPEVAVDPTEIIWLNLDHRAGFVLAQIDGAVSYDDLYAVCGMSRLDTAKILAQLLSERVIRPRR